MSFPIINFKITNAEIGDNLKEITEEKLSTLDKFIGDLPALCEVEFEKITNHHQQGNIFRVEVNLTVNGKLHRAEVTSESFENSADKVREELYNVLQTVKGKRDTILMRGARKLKEMINR